MLTTPQDVVQRRVFLLPIRKVCVCVCVVICDQVEGRLLAWQYRENTEEFVCVKHMIGDEANDGDVSQIKNLSQLPSACKMSASLIQDVTSNKAVRGLPPIPQR